MRNISYHLKSVAIPTFVRPNANFSVFTDRKINRFLKK